MLDMDLPAVLITGGARRLGAALARGFGEQGWHVIIHYGTSHSQASELAASLPSAETFHCDLADCVAAEQMVLRLASKLQNWPVLINCAAIFRQDCVNALDRRTYMRSMQINALTPACMAQAYLASARAGQGRRVIQFTDQKLANPNPDFYSYTISKHAASAMIPLLAIASQNAQDRIYGLAPGAILAGHDQSEEETECSHVLNLLQRKTGADEIVQAALFLAQGFLASGQTLYVDSGQHLLNQPRDVIYLAREKMARKG